MGLWVLEGLWGQAVQWEQWVLEGLEDLLHQWEVMDLEDQWAWVKTAPLGQMVQWDQMDPPVQLVLSLPPIQIQVVILVLALMLDPQVHPLAQLLPPHPREVHHALQVQHQMMIPPAP